MRLGSHLRTAFMGLVAISAMLAVACGTAANLTTAPTSTPSTSPATAGPTPMPTVAPTVTPLPTGTASARDAITLVIDEEPVHINALFSGGGLNAAIYRDNFVDTLTWQSGDDLRIVPTSATTGWEQLGPQQWRFTLRQGVKFHNGEEWNAQAALPSLAFQGVAASNSISFPYTGGFQAEAVDEYTLDINCDQPCPILPNTAFFVGFEAPQYMASATADERTRTTIGFGPYQVAQWEPGVSVTMEAFEDYTPAGDHFEFQKPLVQTARWVWRAEPTVAAAMVSTGEADLAWDVGVDAGDVNTKAGGSSEMFVLNIDTVWHPELKKKEVRQAIAHAIDCQEIVDALYGGHSNCWGNIIFPGVIGATAENTAPYEYDPDLSRQLLADAGYSPDNKITIMGRAARIPKLVEVYEVVQGYLQGVGMNVDISVVEASVRNSSRLCGIGAAVNDAMVYHGKDPATDQPDNEDFLRAMEVGPTSGCTPPQLLENEPSNETLDFGRQVSYYFNCSYVASYFCDPSPGGIQEQIVDVLATSGEERHTRLAELAQKMHDDVLILGLFEIPVVYAIDPKLNWEPRFDRRVRVSAMWFSP